MSKDEFIDAMVELFSKEKEDELLDLYTDSWWAALLATGRSYIELYHRELFKEV